MSLSLFHNNNNNNNNNNNERLTGTSGDLREKSYLFQRTGPLAIPTVDFSFMF